MKFIASWLLPLLLAFLPFSKGIMQFEVGIVTLNPYSLGMILLACLALLFINKNVNSKFNFGMTDFFIVALCLLYLCSTALSDTPVRSGFVAFHALFIPVLSYFVIKSFVRSEKDIHRALLFFVLGLLCFGAIQFVHFLKTFSRTIVLDMNPIDFSTLCIVGILYLLYVRGFKKLSVIVMLLSLVVFLFINLARAYLLALFISPLLYLVIRKGKAAFLMTCLLGGTLAFTVFLAANVDYFRVYESQTIRGEAVHGFDRITKLTYWKQTLYGRGLHFKEGLREFTKAPIVGQGMRTGKSKYSWEHTYFTWHSFNLEWLVFGGIVGYLLYSAVLLSSFRAAGKYARQDKMAATILLAITLILINSATNGIMHGMMPYAVFILLGFSQSRGRELQMNSPVAQR